MIPLVLVTYYCLIYQLVTQPLLLTPQAGTVPQMLHLHSVHIWKILAGTERLEPHFCVSVAVSSAECECLLLCFKAIKQAGCISQLGACHLGSTCISLQLVLKEKEHAFFNHAGVHILPDIPKAT